MSDVYLSYHQSDKDWACRLTTALRSRGREIFMDTTGIVAGDNWEDVLLKEMEETRVIVLLLSAKSQRSAWVETELSEALRRKKPVIPVILSDEGKENWVWPLVADRQALRLKPFERRAHFVARVANAVDWALGESGSGPAPAA